MKVKRAFVTGGNGFIGGVLINKLLASGWTVTALARNQDRGLRGKRVTLIKGDISAKNTHYEEALNLCDAVFHLASIISFSKDDRQKLMAVNEKGAESLLEAARRAGVKRVVVVSSACTLGVHHEAGVVDENVECLPEWRKLNVYLDSKKAQEDVAFQAHKKGLNVVIVNPTTVFGSGDWSLNSGSIIKTVMSKSILFAPPGGSSVVDVDDVVDGIIAAYERGRSGERYVLTANNLTFKEILVKTASAAGVKRRIIPLPRATKPLMEAATHLFQMGLKITGKKNNLITPQIISDTFNFKWYSASKAEKEFGFKPRCTFEDSVRKALKFYHMEKLL